MAKSVLIGTVAVATSISATGPLKAVLRDWYFKPSKPTSYRIHLVGYNTNTPAESAEQIEVVTSVIRSRVDRTTVRTSSGTIYGIEGDVDTVKMESIGGYRKQMVRMFKTGFPSSWKEYLEEDCDRRQHERSIHDKTMAVVGKEVPAAVVPELLKGVAPVCTSLPCLPVGVVPVRRVPPTPKPIQNLRANRTSPSQARSVEIPFVPSRCRRQPPNAPVILIEDDTPVSEEVPFVQPQVRPGLSGNESGGNDEPHSDGIPFLARGFDARHENPLQPSNNSTAPSSSRPSREVTFAIPLVPPLRKALQSKKRPSPTLQIRQSPIRSRLRNRNPDITYLECNLNAPIRKQLSFIKKGAANQAAPKGTPADKRPPVIVAYQSLATGQKKARVVNMAEQSFRAEFASVAKKHPLFALRTPSPTPVKKRPSRQLPISKAPRTRRAQQKPAAKKFKNLTFTSTLKKLPKKAPEAQKKSKASTVKKPAGEKAALFVETSTVKKAPKKTGESQPILANLPQKDNIRKSSLGASKFRRDVPATPQPVKAKKNQPKKPTMQSPPAVLRPVRKNRTVIWFAEEVKKVGAHRQTSAARRGANNIHEALFGAPLLSPSHYVLQPSVDDDDEVGDFETINHTDTTRTFRMSAAPKRAKRKMEEDNFRPSNAKKASDRLNWQGFQQQERDNGRNRVCVKPDMGDNTAASSFWGAGGTTVMNVVQKMSGRSGGLFDGDDDDDDVNNLDD